MRRSAPCHTLTQDLDADPWASDGSPTCETGGPTVSLSPPRVQEVASARVPAVLGATRRDVAQPPGVRWSCPALMLRCASKHVLVAGGFSTEAPHYLLLLLCPHY